MFPKCLFIFFLACSSVFAKVDPPNYNFKLDQITSLLPGKTPMEVEQMFGKGEIYQKDGDKIIYRYSMKHVRYVFPFWVQYEKGKSVDILARLPAYFLHNIFHQSLINRFGPQDKYLKKEEHAVYQWTNKKNFNITYSGACTITCFPVFMHMEIVMPKEKAQSFKSLLKIVSLAPKGEQN